MNTRWMGWVAVAGLLLAGVALAAPQRENGRAGGDRSGVTVQEREAAPADDGEPFAADLFGGGEDLGGPGWEGGDFGGHGAAMHGMGMGGPGMGRHGRHMGMMGGGPGPRMIAQLDLTGAQKEKLADIHERQARKNVELRADLQLAGLDLQKLLRDDRPDQDRIEAQVDRITGLRGEMMKAHIATLLEARSVLTPEQQKKARALHQGMGRDRGHAPDRNLDDSR